MIGVYPVIKVYCPKEQKEQDGNNCLNCKYFRGVSFNDYAADTEKSRLFFRCFYKDEAEEERSE